jgi:hypothetical protein
MLSLKGCCCFVFCLRRVKNQKDEYDHRAGMNSQYLPFIDCMVSWNNMLTARVVRYGMS